MCLNVKEKEFLRVKIAQEDIKCYKVVRYISEVGDDDRKWRTPFIDDVIPMDVIRGLVPFKPDYNCLHDGCFFNWIGGGAIHSVKDFKQADIIRHWLFKSRFEGNVDLRIFECHIPKGTFYAEGVDDWESDGYASSELVFDQEMTITSLTF